ncbi:hypothetical protein Aduo_016018 [Ancylostoma duodenale]
MRIKEAILRKKLIHEMNEEFKDDDFGIVSYNLPALPILPSNHWRTEENPAGKPPTENALQSFVQYLSEKLTDNQKRALKVTWKRLSEAPKTSGRGTIHIMEKVLNKVCECEPHIRTIFYKSAFLSCIEDRKCHRRNGGSIATIRDHAHILVEFIDSVLQAMFEGTVDKFALAPEHIGLAHVRLAPLGFDRQIWHVLGECLAEVMFNQECIRAYPHAPSAWSLLSVAMTEKMYEAGKIHFHAKPRVLRPAFCGPFLFPQNISLGVTKEKRIDDKSEGEFHTARDHIDDLEPAKIFTKNPCNSRRSQSHIRSATVSSNVQTNNSTRKTSKINLKSKCFWRSKSESRLEVSTTRIRTSVV